MEKTQSTQLKKYTYAAVTNIPHNFRAADLRAHFSSLVESQSFSCFHFRHRPEKGESSSSENNSSEATEQTTNKTRKYCCVIKIPHEKTVALLKYNGNNWTDKTNEFYGEICAVSLIDVRQDSSCVSEDEPKNERKETLVDEEVLLQMAELRPPELMPQGNVGTPTLVFLDLIQRCLLPQTLIKKLDLKFPKTQSKRLYDSVSYEYQASHRPSRAGGGGKEGQGNFPYRSTQKLKSSLGKSATKQSLSSRTATKNGEEANEESISLPEIADVHGEKSQMRSSTEKESRASDKKAEDLRRGTEGIKEKTSSLLKSCDQSTSTSQQEHSQTRQSSGDIQHVLTNRQKKVLQKAERLSTRQLMAEGIEEKLIGLEKAEERATEEAGEEWDRHEASEDDPSNQERNKERLYEEEIEQPWEKGGPGVVFYTDAMFWQEKDGDFDEQTTDDLDVDFSAYEEGPGTSDMDMKDFLKVRQEQRFRSGYDKTDRFSIGIGRRISSSSSQDKRRKTRIGEFEKHSKGFGRKVMESHGWTDGEGLGRSQQGMAQALRGEGQAPHNKRGIGFVEEEAPNFLARQKKVKQHLITTKYDHPHHTDPKEPLLQRSEPTTLKHRPEHVDSFLHKNKKL